MIIPVQNTATLQITDSMRVSEIWDWAGLINADAFIVVEDGRLVARWTTYIKDETT
jgi:hypothetical protein